MSSSRSWSRRVRLHRASVEAVRAVTVIAVLPLDAQERLAAGSVVGAYLREEGIDWEAHGDVALGVISGVIQLSLQSRSGRERPVLWLGVGQLVELKVPGWGPPNATVATVVSQEATFVLIPLIPLWKEVDVCKPAVTLRRVEESRVVCALGGLASNGLHARPATRICHEIWREHQGVPGQGIALTQELLAARARTTQPAVSKEIKRLAEEGIIEFDRRKHRIVVLQPDGLIDEE